MPRKVTLSFPVVLVAAPGAPVTFGGSGGIKQNCVQILARDIVIEKSNSSTTETGKGLNVGSAEHSVDSLFEGAFGV